MNIIKKYILRPIVHYPILYFKNKNIPSNPSYATFDASVQDELKRMINKRAALPSVSAIYRIKNGEIFIRISILAIAPLCKEIICVDNGSTDNTIQILEQLQSELAGICEIKIYHYNKNVHLAGVDYKKRILSDKGENSSTLACYIKNKPKIKHTDINSIKIMHGINRRDVKGTETILAALERIDKEYDNVTIYTPERLSQSEYLKLFSEIDISIDQCKCHSYGINAIYAMLNGHVALAPADEKHCQSFKITSTPIISISNNEDDIYQKLKKLITSAETLDEIKMKTLNYAHDFHEPVKVCNRLLDLL